MDPRHFRYAVTPAEERNFTRPDARPGIAQPPLSQRINEMEAQLGCPSSSMPGGIPDGKVARETDAWKQNRAAARRVFSSAGSREGPRALAEKRTPVWPAK